MVFDSDYFSSMVPFLIFFNAKIICDDVFDDFIYKKFEKAYKGEV